MTTGLVLYTDGSCRPNPGYSGYGIYGYSYKHTIRSKNTNHPWKNKTIYSSTGVVKNKTTDNIEVLSIYEVSAAINLVKSTNNLAELKACVRGFKLAHELSTEVDDFTEFSVFTDSNYVVTCVNESLDEKALNGWKRQDGKPLSNQEDWELLYIYKQALVKKGVKIAVKWVEGHSEDYGNSVADTYSVIASNAARIQIETNAVFKEDILYSVSSYKDYKKSYDDRDFIYHYKDLFFSSQELDDRNYCFINSTEVEYYQGNLRSNDAIFVANVGYVPKLVNDIRSYYRGLTRSHRTTCIVKLTRLSNRDLLRLGDMVDIKYMLLPMTKGGNSFELVSVDGVFLQECHMEFPFIMNINALSTAMERTKSFEEESVIVDITEMLVKDGKIAIPNSVRGVDITHLTENKLKLLQRVFLKVGSDIPNYLSLKRIEGDIQSVEAMLHKSVSGYYSLITKITTGDRLIYSLNVPNKYLEVVLKKKEN